MISRVKGTQDFLDMRLYNFIKQAIAKQVACYGFSEIATPIIESTELFVRSLGTETDVVSKEMFLIQPRTQNDDSLCLRPEATASTVRAFVQNGVTQMPWKVFSSGPMFRYERPQKGRYRQFHQVNIEVIGSCATSEDVQLIVMLDRLFHEVFHFNNYALHVNFLGCTSDRSDYTHLLQKFLMAHDQLCHVCIHRRDTNPLRVFDCKQKECHAYYMHAPKITDHLCNLCIAQWNQLQEQLHILSVSFVYRPTLVRGLDYYNKVVFEFVSDNLGAQNAFCAGGRYDQLVGYISGGADHGCVGAAIGIERLMLALEPVQNQLPISNTESLYIIIPFESAQESLALLLADEMRAVGHVTDILFDGTLKGNLRRAQKRGAQTVLLLGPEEQNNHEVTIKHMVSGTQTRIKQSALIDYLTR